MRVGRLEHDQAGPVTRRLGVISSAAMARVVADAVAAEGFEIVVRCSSFDAWARREAEQTLDACVLCSKTFAEAEARDLRGLVKHLGAVPIIVVAATDGRAIRDAVTAGASGFVAIDDVAAQLAATVNAVCAGQLTVPIQFRHAFAKPVLSPRERQIMSMVVMGFSNREIANRLFLAETTIKSHLSSAFVKLGVRSRHEATSLILDSANGLGTGILAMADDVEKLAPIPR